MNSIKRVCVFCASSSEVDKEYLDAAELTARIFVKHNIHVVYGGGAVGLMGKLADTIIKEGGMITGIIPGFMKEMELLHKGINETIEVEDLHQRKRLMVKQADAIVALPGGIGTLEELTEAMVLKQLGQLLCPIIIVNTNGFYNKLIELFEKMIKENFMHHLNRKIWEVVEQPSEIIPAILNSAPLENSSINLI